MLRVPLWMVVTLTDVKTRQQYPYVYIQYFYSTHSIEFVRCVDVPCLVR